MSLSQNFASRYEVFVFSCGVWSSRQRNKGHKSKPQRTFTSTTCDGSDVPAAQLKMSQEFNNEMSDCVSLNAADFSLLEQQLSLIEGMVTVKLSLTRPAFCFRVVTCFLWKRYMWELQPVTLSSFNALTKTMHV